MHSDQTLSSDRIGLWVFATLGLLLALRLAVILVSPMELYADEAQYWRWGQSLEWGYYSKPPMIAWVIHATTSVFGNDEWAIRLAAPFLHTLAAASLFLLGRAMFGATAGAMAAIGYAVMPGVMLSSTVISTDGVLLPVWSLALLMFWQLRSGDGRWLSAIGLGLAMGVGMLSKYAMVYFLIGMVLTLLFDRPSRKALLSLNGGLALIVAAIVVAPHFAWNAANDFKTVSHTLDNANLEGPLLNPENAITFIVDQMGVFGPVSFLGLIGGLIFMTRSGEQERGQKERWLMAFIVPALVIIMIEAVVSRAHANWAATAYPAASILIASFFLRASANRWLWFSIAGLTLIAFQLAPDVNAIVKLAIGVTTAIAILIVGMRSHYRPVGLFWSGLTLHAVLGVIMMGMLVAPPAWTAVAGLDNALKRTRGWEAMAEQVVTAAKETGASAVMVDEREIWHGIDYYARGRLDVPLIAWRYNPGIKSFSETEMLTDADDDNVLIASYRPNRRPRIRADFNSFDYLRDLSVALGQRSNGCPIERRLALYLGSGFEPLPRDAAWLEAYDGMVEGAPPPCPAQDDAAATEETG